MEVMGARGMVAWRQLPSTHAPNPPKHAHEDIGGAANVCWHLAVACTSQRQCAGLEGPQRRREARLSAIILCKGREAWREHHSQPDAACASTPLESRTEGETTLVDNPEAPPGQGRGPVFIHISKFFFRLRA